MIVAPNGGTWVPPRPHIDSALVKAIARDLTDAPSRPLNSSPQEGIDLLSGKVGHPSHLD
jgi:hypothetical protein